MLSRRSFVLGALAAKQRPNIIWLSSEDTSPTLGCYGDPHAITPTLDKLASQGTRYTHAYTNAGVCAPSRSGIITGMYPSSLGSQHMRCNAQLPPHVRAFPAYLRDAGYYCTNNAKTDYNFDVPKDAWDEVSRNAHWKNRKPGQPFFAVFNHEVSHESRLVLRGAEHEKNVRALKPSERRDPAKLALPPYHADTAETRRDWANYHEVVTATDYQIGAKLKDLENTGLLEDTIVCYWGDHGTGLPRAKRWLYESGTHVPLIIRIPEKFRVAGQGRPGSVDSQLVAMIDLAPTMLNLAGVPLPSQFQGRAFLGANLTKPRQYVYGARDRMDERYDIIRAVRDNRYRYVRNYEADKPYYQHMSTPEGGPAMKELRRTHAEGTLGKDAELFMADHKPEEELYDVNADPHEIRNLASDPKHASTLRRMRKAHLDWVHETKDVGLIPEPELEIREKKYGSRHAILRAPENAGLLDRLLNPKANDPDPAVRYRAIRTMTSGLEPYLADPAAVVRIEAARKLARVDVIVKELKSEVDSVRLHAALALDSLGPKAKPAEPALREAMNDENRYVPRVAGHALKQLG